MAQGNKSIVMPDPDNIDIKQLLLIRAAVRDDAELRFSRKFGSLRSQHFALGNMLRLLSMAILVSLLEMLGCKGVQPSDLAGTWVIKDSSRQLLPTELQKAAATVVLDSNGTFVASEIPEELPPVPPYDPKHRNIRLDTGSGNWQLISREGKKQIQLNFLIMQGSSNLPYGTQMNISSLWSVSLYYFLGDADEGRRMSFERR